MRASWSLDFPINSTRYLAKRRYAANCLVEREFHSGLNKMLCGVWTLNKGLNRTARYPKKSRAPMVVCVSCAGEMKFAGRHAENRHISLVEGDELRGEDIRARRISAAENALREDLTVFENIGSTVEMADAELMDDPEHLSMGQ